MNIKIAHKSSSEDGPTLILEDRMVARIDIEIKDEVFTITADEGFGLGPNLFVSATSQIILHPCTSSGIRIESSGKAGR